MIITIDGPAGTGKTTVAQKVAASIKLPYFDTGAMYRSVAFVLLHEKIPLSDVKQIGELLSNFRFEIKIIQGIHRYFANGMDVTDVIRSPAVTNTVSAVSALPVVREALWIIQRRFAKKRGGVFEGRDMGTVVFPKADYKLFITARPEIRAERRLSELKEKRPDDAKHMTHEQMIQEIIKRDEHDSTRSFAPLRCPQDAYVIDTSELTLDEVVARVLEYYEKKSTLPAWAHWRGTPFLYRIVLCFAWLIGKIFYRSRIYGLEHFYPRGAILAANHTSYLDPPIVSVSWPEVVHFLARKTLFRSKLFGGFIRKLNTHPVTGESGDIQVMKLLVSLLEEGKKVVLFPEGTRSENGELQPIKPGIGLLVARSKSAIIPVYIHGAYEVWGRKRKLPRLFGKVRCVYGSPITWDSVAGLDKKEAQLALAQKLEDAWKGLKLWLEQGAIGIPP
jgi:1-acyl-sn-glycerol-3-phosphate acyltransferase